MSNTLAQQASAVPFARRNRSTDGRPKPRTAEAIALASTQAPHLADLAEAVIPTLPYQVLASADIKSRRAWSIVEPICFAVGRQYLGLSNDRFVNAVIIDCDHADATRWRTCRLPPPTWIAVTPESGRHHLVWLLARPVYKGPGAALGPLRYLARVVSAMTYELGGDEGYAGALTKNPWHPRWHVILPGGCPVELGDLYRAICCAPNRPRQRQHGEVRFGIGRNVELFDRLRYWAYANKRRHGDRRSWGQAVAAQAAAINQSFASPLPPNELGWTVQSVANWVWTRYQGGTAENRRGAMGLDVDMPLADKQAMAGSWSAAKRRSATDQVLADAVQSLRAAGQAVTQVAVAQASGKGIATIKRRWAAVTAMLAEPLQVVPAPEVAAPRPVLVSLPGGKVDLVTQRSTPHSRAEAWQRFKVAVLAQEIEAERRIDAEKHPGAGTGRPPVPAFLVAANRLRRAG